MKSYMVFADAPPPGCGAGDELLVSLTYGDVIEAYEDFYWDDDSKMPHWVDLSPSTQHLIFKEVGESGINLTDIFDELVRPPTGYTTDF